MFARAEIEADATRGGRRVVAAPASAIYEVNGAQAVFVQTETQIFSVRPVVVGAAGREDVEIISGLHDGDRVVTHGGLLLKALAVNTSD